MPENLFDKHVAESNQPIKQPDNTMPSPPQRGENYVTWGTMIYTLVLMCFLSSGITIYVYDKYYAPKFLSFDLAGYLKNVQSDLAKSMSTEQSAESRKIQENKLAAEMIALEKLISEQPTNTIILSGDVVLGNSKPVKKIQPPSHQ